MNRKMRLPLLLAWALALPAMAQAELTLVNPNLADKDELRALPNVGDEIAQAIIDGRPYLSAIDLDTTLAGVMDDEQRATLYTRLFRPIDLNNASEAEILLIPGMSKKMAHEFLEYRPYKSMEQFRREIGKALTVETPLRFRNPASKATSPSTEGCLDRNRNAVRAGAGSLAPVVGADAAARVDDVAVRRGDCLLW